MMIKNIYFHSYCGHYITGPWKKKGITQESLIKFLDLQKKKIEVELFFIYNSGLIMLILKKYKSFNIKKYTIF